jgi:hypothetical protein
MTKRHRAACRDGPAKRHGWGPQAFRRVAIVVRPAGTDVFAHRTFFGFNTG